VIQIQISVCPLGDLDLEAGFIGFCGLNEPKKKRKEFDSSRAACDDINTSPVP
jgi:hypothetical protein